MADERFQSDRECDPIAELARLIGQADRHRRSVPAERHFREETTSRGHDESPEPPPAPQLPGHWDAHEQEYGLDEHRGSEEVDDADDQHCVAGQDYEDYQNEVLRKRRSSLTLVMAITGLALVGSAGAFGYRNILSGSVIPTALPSHHTSHEPNTTAPGSGKPQSNNSRNLSQADPETTGSIDNKGSRENRSVLVEPPKPVLVAMDPPRPAPTISASSERVGQSGAADVTAALNPEDQAVAAMVVNARSTTPAVSGNGYAVQVSSERSENRAQAAFRALQAKYPNQLSGRQPLIRRTDLGATGIYYRALVGPFASAKKAATSCGGLKAAGGDCIIQKN